MLSRPAALLFLIFFKTTLSSSGVKCPNLTSKVLSIICSIGVSETSGALPSRSLKWPFHLYNLSAWLVAFNFNEFDDFLPLTSFTVFQARADCLFTAALLIKSWPTILYGLICHLISQMPRGPELYRSMGKCQKITFFMILTLKIAWTKKSTQPILFKIWRGFQKWYHLFSKTIFYNEMTS